MGAARSRWCVVRTMVRSALAEAREKLDHLARAFDIHVGKGLVEQQQLRHGKQNAGQRGALAHALRILAEGAIELRVEADLAQSFGRREAGAAGIKACGSSEILLRGELVVEHGRMAHVADAGAGFVRLEIAEDADGAVRGSEKAGENAQQRGLARAIFAEQNVAAARLKIDRDLAKRGKAAEELGHLIEPCAESGAGGFGGRWRHSISCWRFVRRMLARADAVLGFAGVAPEGAAPGCAGAYLLAHLAWRTVAWKTPSRP